MRDWGGGAPAFFIGTTESFRELAETPDSEMEARPPLRRRWRGHHAAGALLSLALLATICVLGALAAVLATGRLSLDFLKPVILSSLNQRLGPGYALDIHDLALERRNYGLALAMNTLVVVRPDGRPILTAPKADLMFEPFALLGGSFKPSRVELEDLRVELHVRPDGALDLVATDAVGEAPDAAPAPSEPAPQISVAPPTSAPQAPRAKILRQAAAAINALFDMASGGASPIAALDHFAIRRGRLVIDDEVAGQKRGFEDFAFALDRSRAEGKGVAKVSMAARGPSGRWSVKGAARGARGEAHDMSIDAEGFSIDEIALLAGKTGLPVDSDIPISFKAAASFTGEGHVLDANARMALGAGFWRFDDPDFAPVFIDELFAAAHWDSSGHRAIVDEAQVFSGATRFFVNGAIAPPPDDPAGWRIEFRQSEPCVIGPERGGGTPVVLNELHGEFALDPGAKLLTIGRVEAIGPEVGVAAQGTFDWTAGPHLRLGVAASRTSAAAVLALWPNIAGAPARGWVGEHLIGGELENLRLAIDLDDADLRMMRAQRPPMDDRISADYTIKDGAMTFLDGAPPVIGGMATGHSGGRTTRIAIGAAAVEAAPGRRVDLNDGVFAMTNPLAKPPEIQVSAHAKGAVDVLGDILSRPGFVGIASLPLDPKTTRGQFDANFTYRMKIGVADASLEVNGKAENFSAEKILGKERLEQANLAVSVASGGMRISGAGKLFGAPATLELTRVGGNPAQGVISLTMDEAARQKAGLPFGATVAGPLAVRITGPVGVARAQAQVDMDLTRTALNYPAPGVYKPAGRPAKVSFNWREDERGGAALEQIVFDGAGQSAKGSAQLAADGALTAAKFQQLRLSPGDSLDVDAQKSGDHWKVTAKGAALDARPFLKSLSESGSGRSNADFDLDLSTTVMSGANRQIIANAVLRVSRKGGHYQTLEFSGKQGADALRGVLSHGAEGTPAALRVTTSDGGALLAFLDVYSHMEGGALSADLRLSDAGVSGPLDIENFTLRGEPAMRSFANAPNSEQLTSRLKIDPNVVSFSKLHALLDWRSGKLTVRDGTINSPNIGSTLEGWIDFDRNALDLAGVFVPAYGVNNLFGQLPVLGLVLGGGSQEGLIGLNYRVTGKTTAPVLSINPLSAIAPGFLRKIFGVLPP